MQIILTAKEKKLFIFMVVLVGVTVLIPNLALQYATTSLQEAGQAERQLKDDIVDTQSRLSTIEVERESIRINREDYLRWVEKGVVGEQDTVEFVKEMKNIQKSRNLFPISFDFAKDQPLQPSSDSPFTDGSNVQIRLWDMEMEMDMLHDLDVLMFLDSLRERVDSFFFPVECSFDLLEENFSLVNQENMHSACRLTWISVEDPDKKI